MRLRTHPDHSSSAPRRARDENRRAGFYRFLASLQLDLKLVLLGVVWLQLVRWILIASAARDLAPSSGFGDFVSVSLAGLRFDLRIAIGVALPSILISYAQLRWDLSTLARRVRLVLGIGFFVTTLVLGRIAVAYLREFHSLFDQFVLGAVFDDRWAVMGTLAKLYAPVPELSVGLALALAGAWVTAWWIRRPVVSTPWLAHHLSTTSRRIALAVLVAIAIAAGLRGSVGRRPVQEKDAAITPDPALAGLVLNPYESLRYAVKHYWKVVGSRGLETYLPDGDIAGALQEYAGRPVHDIDSALVRVAPGRAGAEPPRHVFLVVMESYGGWTLLDEYAPLGLSNGLRGLASGGLLLRNFLSASSGTMTSVAAIITGLPDAGIVTNREPSARAPYPSSLAAIFRSLGYRTQLFYGGYLSWQKVGDFAKAQGFDRVYGGAHMGSWLETNEWGVDDEALFDFVSRTISDDEPTFDLILSGSNHPPYDLDVYGKGFPLKTIPKRYRDGFEHGNADLVQLGHHWYADRAVSRWVTAMAERFPSALFAVTGDHWSRRFIGPHPSLFVRSAVPLLLYGPPFRNAKLPEGAVGSHLDIGPTLISRVAERGFVYHATGHDLLDPDRPTVAIARRAMIGSGVILDPTRPGKLERVPGLADASDTSDASDAPADSAPIDPKAWRRQYAVLEAVAWWRMMRGNDVPGAQPPHSADSTHSTSSTEAVRRSAANLPAIHEEDRR